MLTVIIPTLNAESGLTRTLSGLLAANAQGLIREVIVADGGSTDQTLAIAADAGVEIVASRRGRGAQLRAGAERARGDWLLFLHADTWLAPGWERVVERHVAGAHERVAATFRLRFDATGFGPALVARGANVRARLCRLPYGDQGLLIARSHYTRLGGFPDWPLFEDVELVRAIVRDGGRRALSLLPADAVTSASRYQADGYMRRVLRNGRCLALYFAGVPASRIVEIYHGRSRALAHHDGKAATRRPRKDAS